MQTTHMLPFLNAVHRAALIDTIFDRIRVFYVSFPRDMPKKNLATYFVTPWYRYPLSMTQKKFKNARKSTFFLSG